VTEVVSQPRSNVPVPDPSALTTEQIRRELNLLQSLLESKIGGIETKAVSDFSLVTEKFRSVETRANVVEVAQKEAIAAAAAAGKTSIDAALQAQKEAAGKSEVYMVEQLKGIQAILATNNASLNDKIAVINGRLDRGEGGSNAHSSTVAMAVAIASVLISLVIGGFSAISSHNTQPGVTIPPPVTVNPR